MWQQIEDFFLSSAAGLAMLMAVLVTLFICCARFVSYYSTKVMPKRIASSSDRRRCAGAIERKLRGFSASHSCRMLKNVRLGEQAVADLLLVGLFGAVAFVGCDEQGEIYPVDEQAVEMTGYLFRTRMKYKNPLRERRLAERGLQEALNLAGFKNVRGRAVVVFTNRRCTPVAPPSDSYCQLGELSRRMGGAEYDQDLGVDPDAVAKIFEDRVME